MWWLCWFMYSWVWLNGNSVGDEWVVSNNDIEVVDNKSDVKDVKNWWQKILSLSMSPCKSLMTKSI